MRQLVEEAMREITPHTHDEALAVALEIDRVASEDEYFKSRRLVANTDLFLSLLYVAM